VDHLGYCHCRIGWQPLRAARYLSLGWFTTVVVSHSHARARLVEPWALPCGGLEGSQISLDWGYNHHRVHCLKYSSLNLAFFPCRIGKYHLDPTSLLPTCFRSDAARLIASSRGPENAHISETKVYSPAPGTGSLRVLSFNTGCQPLRISLLSASQLPDHCC